MASLPGSMRQVLARASQTSDPWGRYYSAPMVSRTLIDRIEVVQPKLVLELGSGSGSLCTVAANRWKDAKLVTVDIDRGAPKCLDSDHVRTGHRHRHFVHDVLDAALLDKIGLLPSTVDVAVCNPPYIRPKWRAEFGNILEGAGIVWHACFTARRWCRPAFYSSEFTPLAPEGKTRPNLARWPCYR